MRSLLEADLRLRSEPRRTETNTGRKSTGKKDSLAKIGPPGLVSLLMLPLPRNSLNR